MFLIAKVQFDAFKSKTIFVIEMQILEENNSNDYGTVNHDPLKRYDTIMVTNSDSLFYQILNVISELKNHNNYFWLSLS
jgi:hypothetical protein